MTTVTLKQAQANLPELIEDLVPGEELVITNNERPVALLVAPEPTRFQPVFGRGRGKVVVVSEDEDHLIDFDNSGLLP